jgi:ATP adenylyltransferase
VEAQVPRSICIFCAHQEIIDESSTAVAIHDKFPVVEGHVLVFPRHHVLSIFELSDSELSDCFHLLKRVRNKIMEQDTSVTGFNVGINDGTDAGQTIMHCHIHLITRRKGDVEDPRGGVRNIIPGKGRYD